MGVYFPPQSMGVHTDRLKRAMLIGIWVLGGWAEQSFADMLLSGAAPSRRLADDPRCCVILSRCTQNLRHQFVFEALGIVLPIDFSSVVVLY